MSDTNRHIRRHVLSDGDQRVAILSLGCITQSWHVPLDSRTVPVVLGFPEPENYRDNPAYMGAIVGRLAGRISDAAFDLDGRRWALAINEPPNHLHGGPGGIQVQNWKMEPAGDRAVRLTLHSPHGDQGYPGALDIDVTVTLSGGWLTYDMRAQADRPTPVSLTQHSYYNLMGGGAIWDHRVGVPARSVAVVSGDLVATGETASLDGQPFDLRHPRSLASADPGRAGLDLTYLKLTATHSSPVTVEAPGGLRLEMVSDQPCLQLFTGSNLAPRHGQDHAPFGGLCLEPQGYPNAINRPGFPVSMATPDAPYRQRLSVRVTQGPVG